jgi:hypothetical protein
VSTVRTKRTYLRNYSPLKYETDDVPDLFAAASRGGMRIPTFAEGLSESFTAEPAPTFRRESRDIVASMTNYEDGVDVEVHKAKLPKKPTSRQHSVSPWFALASGMVVAGAVVMALVAVTPDNVIPKGAIAKVVGKVFTATVIFSRD